MAARNVLRAWLLPAAAALVMGLLPAPAAAGSRAAAPTVSVVASGLNSPRGLASRRGSLLVAEAGKGGSGPCGPGALGRVCLGLTGAVTQVVDGGVVRLVDLPSLALRDGSFAFGPHDVAFGRHGSMFATVGLAEPPEFEERFGPRSALLGQLVELDGSGGAHAVADLAAYEARHDPDGVGPESDPYGLLRRRGASIVTDAAANDLLKVRDDGRISTLAVFPARRVEFRGQRVPMQAVPTAVVRGPDGAYYVGELTGFPFPRGGARVYRVVPGERPEVYARGFTNIIDIAFDGDGNLYVLEIAHNSLRADQPFGALLRVAPSGETTTVLDEGLFTPTSFVLEGRRKVLVTNCGVCAGGGEVLEVRL